MGNMKIGRVVLALVLALTLAVVPLLALKSLAQPAKPEDLIHWVVNTNDTGTGSLRKMIEEANNSAEPDIIVFSIPSCDGACLIQPMTPLPPLTDSEIIIDGYSQIGSIMATDSSSATILIQIDGSNAGAGHGLEITSSENKITGLSITGFQGDGIRISGSGAFSNSITGNYIGIDPTGTFTVAQGHNGVFLHNGADNNIVGGNRPADRNIISGNGKHGVSISGDTTDNNIVIGNYIGTDADGKIPLGNAEAGIHIDSGADSNIIGRTSAGEGNLISGNYGDGVEIEGTNTSGNTVSGNYIGTDASGTGALSNITGVNIYNGARLNSVDANVISGNSNYGIIFSGENTSNNTITDNYIGTNISGTEALANGLHGINFRLGTHHNTIGGFAKGNVVSGNTHCGVRISGDGTRNNQVLGNYIGTDVNGTADIANEDCGVWIYDGAQFNTIGGDTNAKRNVISGNANTGVRISGEDTINNTVANNYIGVDTSGMAALGNMYGVAISNGSQFNTVGPDNLIANNYQHGIRVLDADTKSNYIIQNSIYDNDSKGIYLGPGAHGGILPPNITAVNLGSIEIVGTTCGYCVVELFQNSNDDGQGESYLGIAPAGQDGIFTFTVHHLDHHFLTATAMQVVSGTSEFSAPFETGISRVMLPLVIK
jgi:hypothetical protein